MESRTDRGSYEQFDPDYCLASVRNGMTAKGKTFWTLRIVPRKVNYAKYLDTDTSIANTAFKE